MPPKTTPPSPLGDLGKLPPELRNEIYKHALTSANPIEISRCRVPNPKWTPENDKKNAKTIGGGESKCLWRCAGVVRRPQDKESCKIPAVQALAINLLRTSKAIQNEATSILYGANKFEFQTDFALGQFTSTRTTFRFPLITRISIGFEFTLRMGKILELIRRLTRPQQIELRLRSTYGLSPASKTAVEARGIWRHIRSFVSTESLRIDQKSFDLLRRSVEVDLPEELKLRRLNLFHFAVPGYYQFEVEDGGKTSERTIEDPEQRSAKFRELVAHAIDEEAQQTNRAEILKGEAVEEMLSSGRAIGLSTNGAVGT